MKSILIRMEEEKKRRFQAMCALDGVDMQAVINTLVDGWMVKRKLVADWTAAKPKGPKGAAARRKGQ
jgi:hypothetical protein